ncbi:hypothetical protein [Neobacillus novalis]|uniref:hypothetical protein n=1 Tax=Neobacillus novalis TaxID=220687 RepID=UPI000B12800F|nr:hypothetical protein [Neobacillus novalis]
MKTTESREDKRLREKLKDIFRKKSDFEEPTGSLKFYIHKNADISHQMSVFLLSI